MRYDPDPDLRRTDGGRVAIGGSPTSILRLSESGAGLLDRLIAGDEPEGTAAERFASRLVDRGVLVPRPAFAPDAARDVTVVVPVRDRADELDRALAALGKGSPPGRTLVVDDGSVDAAAVAAVVARHGVELLRRDRSEGPAAARNTGLAEVTTPWVAFVDSDVEVGDEWLGWLVRHLEDDRTALVAPRVLPPSLEPDAGAWRRYEQTRSPLDLGPRPGPVRPRSRCSYVPAAAIVCRVDALRDVGGFDERMRVGEDVDLVWRLVDAGWRCWYAGDEVWVTHAPRPDVLASLRQRARYGTSAAALHDRHPGEVAPLTVSGWSVGVWAAVATGHPWVAAGLAAGTIERLSARLDFLEHPREEALRLAGRGHLAAGELIGRAVVRPWWPVAVAASLVSRRARRATLAAAIVPPLLAWRRQRPALGPAAFVACHLADEVAYSAGVWAGCARRRSWGALAPRLRAWPGRDGILGRRTV